MPATCVVCRQRYPQIRRSASRQPYCKECFFTAFEDEIHRTIIDQQLFSPHDRVAIAISGGKGNDIFQNITRPPDPTDSTVLAHVMKLLNERHHYQLSLFLLAVDEGITGYRDDSLQTVKRNEKQFMLPLKIVSYEDLYGWRMDQVVATVGKKNNCTFCGVFRRQALDRGALQLNATKICTGHNADDAAETALMNLLRGDVARLARCSNCITGRQENSALPRCKPLMFTYEKEIVLYAHFKNLDYFSTECTYASSAYRGAARELIKSLEAIDSRTILNILFSMSQLYCTPSTSSSFTLPGRCERCQWISSNTLCKCCSLLQGLNSKNPNIALANKAKQQRYFKAPRTNYQSLALENPDNSFCCSQKKNQTSCQCLTNTLRKH